MEGIGAERGGMDARKRDDTNHRGRGGRYIGHSPTAGTLGSFHSPGPMPQGVSYVHNKHGPANLYIRKHNTHQSTSGPVPCTIEAITQSGTDALSSRPTGPFFTQRRGTGFLRS